MNQINNTHKGIEELKKISLSKEAKQGMFERLSLYAEEHPIPTLPMTLKSPWYSSFFQYTHYHRSAYMIATFATLVIIGGNISYAAEQSLPGDLLYPVKLRVNEKVGDALQFTSEAKVSWATVKVQKRLQEAQTLIDKGAFDDTKRVQIEQEVEKNVETIRKQKSKQKTESATQQDDTVKELYTRFERRNAARKANSNKDNNSQPSVNIDINASTTVESSVIKNTSSTSTGTSAYGRIRTRLNSLNSRVHVDDTIKKSVENESVNSSSQIEETTTTKNHDTHANQQDQILKFENRLRKQIESSNESNFDR
jgi:hypothetical protein